MTIFVFHMIFTDQGFQRFIEAFTEHVCGGVINTELPEFPINREAPLVYVTGNVRPGQ